MITPILVNRYHNIPYDVYIGRGTIWGNPVPIDKNLGITREMAVELYREHLIEQIEEGIITIQDFKNLSGKTICCSCSPRACHGDIIIEFFNEIRDMENE